MVPLERDARGYESQLATNHLGHFQLGVRLGPPCPGRGGPGRERLVLGAPPFGHRVGRPQLRAARLRPLGAYGQSKTATNLFAVELDRRGRDDGIRGFSLHPGSIVTSAAPRASVADLQSLGLVDEAGEPIIDPA